MKHDLPGYGTFETGKTYHIKGFGHAKFIGLVMGLPAFTSARVASNQGYMIVYPDGRKESPMGNIIPETQTVIYAIAFAVIATLFGIRLWRNRRKK